MIFFSSQRSELEVAQNEAQKIFNEIGARPRVISAQNFSTFCGEFGYSFKLIFAEKEIIFFAIMQWLVIGLAYTIWTQILDWIPDSLWEEVGKSNNKNDDGAFILINLVLLAWSFFVVVVASYPLSLLNASMTAAHYLRSSNQTSTIAKCLNLAFKNLGRLWVFTTIDAWITVNALLDRLPKKRRRRNVFDELLYYAWKIGTIGVLPALVAGKGYMDAAKDSITLIKNNPVRAIGIRMGYSLVCWIIGIMAYIGSIIYFIKFGDHTNKVNEIFNFYFLMVVPVFVAVGVTAVLVRPFFLIMIAKLYTDVIPIEKEVTVITAGKKLDLLASFFAFLLGVLLGLYFFGDQIGIREWIESLAAKDIREYRQLTPTSQR